MAYGNCGTYISLASHCPHPLPSSSHNLPPPPLPFSASIPKRRRAASPVRDDDIEICDLICEDFNIIVATPLPRAPLPQTSTGRGASFDPFIACASPRAVSHFLPTCPDMLYFPPHSLLAAHTSEEPPWRRLNIPPRTTPHQRNLALYHDEPTTLRDAQSVPDTEPAAPAHAPPPNVRNSCPLSRRVRALQLVCNGVSSTTFVRLVPPLSHLRPSNKIPFLNPQLSSLPFQPLPSPLPKNTTVEAIVFPSDSASSPRPPWCGTFIVNDIQRTIC
ncbi:hypothetical protein DFH08DRAFT_1082990 [Mycena albidolilacea]|uniref:Uncharacterized protein n=1 Tax=Mycena albidolilacea TaxID=1033008 RepID=A0AAD6ZSL2_9AGAR|nr:hypothetical protein DFH08DRAFT_1082990 [Mycena albidolilacea]